MTYTIKTFLHNAKVGSVEDVYSYVIFCLLLIYWVYSPEWLYNKFTELNHNPYEMVLFAQTFSMLITSSLLVIYFNTKNNVVSWLKEVYKL